MLISFEGIDGSGKSTQIERLRDRLTEQGEKVLVCREPGGTEVSELIRGILLNPDFAINSITETLLFSAARSQLIAEVVKPALQRGEIVIMDRFFDSTTAYQGYARKALTLDQIEKLNTMASHGLEPDITIYLRIDYDEAEKRRAHMSKDRMELSGKSFYQNVIKGFDTIAKSNKRVYTIKANNSMDIISNEIMDIFTKVYRNKRIDLP